MCFSPCQDWDEWCYGTFSYDPNVQPMDDGKGVLINYNKAGTLGTRYIMLVYMMHSVVETNARIWFRLHLLCDYNFAGMDKYNITKVSVIITTLYMTNNNGRISIGSNHIDFRCYDFDGCGLPD